MIKLTMSQMGLANLLFSRSGPYMLPNGQIGIFQSALKESGCGTSFILTFNVNSKNVQVLCKIK